MPPSAYCRRAAAGGERLGRFAASAAKLPAAASLPRAACRYRPRRYCRPALRAAVRGRRTATYGGGTIIT